MTPDEALAYLLGHLDACKDSSCTFHAKQQQAEAILRRALAPRVLARGWTAKREAYFINPPIAGDHIAVFFVQSAGDLPVLIVEA